MSRTKSSNPKVAALQRHGALHRSPETVQDGLFHGQPFFDPRDLVQVKYEMVRRVEKESWTPTQAAATFGFSRPAFYAAQKALKAKGLTGLIPKKRGPKGAHKLTGDVLAFARQLREQNPKIKLVAILKSIQDKFGKEFHRRTLERALDRRGKERP